MPLLDDYLHGVVRVARTFLGSHYLHGGCGNRPGESDGHPHYANRVQRYVEPTGGHARPRPYHILYAAHCDSDHDVICTGRHETTAGRKKRVEVATFRDPTFLSLARQDPQKHAWPRPFGTDTVFGEVCDGMHHFDCIGLVNFCIWRTTGLAHHHPSIQQVHRWWWNTQGSTPIPLNQVQVGDILVLRGTNHIGIASGAGQMINAKGEGWGVLEEHIGPGKEILRPTEHFFTALYGG